MIIRVFRARIQKEQVSVYKRMIQEQTIPWLRETKGMVDIFVGEPLDNEEREFVVVTLWQDLDALKTFVDGTNATNWKEPVVTPDETSLVEEMVTYHYRRFDEE